MDKIAQWFFKPLMRLRPDGVTHKEWLEYLFGIPQGRQIIRYKCIEPFNLTGLQYTKWGVEVNRQYRRVRENQELFVRTDPLLVDRIDIEIITGVPGQTLVYQLNTVEWGRIKFNLEEIVCASSRDESDPEDDSDPVESEDGASSGHGDDGTEME